jgi:hypothetical protein
VLNLVLCHHPPSWFLDHDAVDDAVNGRVKLQLFGHKHRQRCERVPEYMRFSAGAVNPDRTERDWRPGYNLIEVTIEGKGADRVVKVEAEVRHLQTAPEMFTALKTADQEEVWAHKMRFPARSRFGDTGTSITQSLNVAVPEKSAKDATEAKSPQGGGAEVAMNAPNTKNLVYRFSNLAVSQKREIAFKLKLITDADLNVPEPERYTKALKLASEKGLLDQLALEIERAEGENS